MIHHKEAIPLKVIHQPRLLPIISFSDHDVPHMIPLPINLLEPPYLKTIRSTSRILASRGGIKKAKRYLISRPPIIVALHIPLDMFPIHIIISLFQELIIIHICQLYPSTLPFTQRISIYHHSLCLITTPIHTADESIHHQNKKSHTFPLIFPKILSSWSLYVQSSILFSVVPPTPPVATCDISTCVLSSLMYSVMVRVMVAREMALRRNQPTPCCIENLSSGCGVESRWRGWEGGEPSAGCSLCRRRVSYSGMLLVRVFDQAKVVSRACTMTHFPLRSLSVFSGGAAILDLLLGLPSSLKHARVHDKRYVRYLYASIWVGSGVAGRSSRGGGS